MPLCVSSRFSFTGAMAPRRRPPRPLVMLTGLIFACLLSGCGAEEVSGWEVYRVRGVIESLPDASDPTSGLRVHHEAIPTFVGADGRMVGMGAMTMPFTPAAGVSLDGLGVGDKVAFTLRMNFVDNRAEVAEFSKLPDDTQLEFDAVPAAP